jgi:hypothetical protein
MPVSAVAYCLPALLCREPETQDELVLIYFVTPVGVGSMQTRQRAFQVHKCQRISCLDECTVR